MSSGPQDLQSGPIPDDDQKTYDVMAADSVLEQPSTILTSPEPSSRGTSTQVDDSDVAAENSQARPSVPSPRQFDIPANESYALPRISLESEPRAVARKLAIGVQWPTWRTLPVPFSRTHPGTGEEYLCRNAYECIGKPGDYKINGEPIRQGVGVYRYGGKNAFSEMVERERSKEMRLCADCYLRRLARRK